MANNPVYQEADLDGMRGDECTHDKGFISAGFCYVKRRLATISKNVSRNISCSKMLKVKSPIITWRARRSGHFPAPPEK
jgi:hypothetical protein